VRSTRRRLARGRYSIRVNDQYRITFRDEFLKNYDPPVSQVEAADRMHIPKVRLNQLIRGNRGVTPDTALRLADLTGTSAEFWMNLQCRYDLWRAAEARAQRRESKIRPLAKASSC
jgi:addiction module HigA family antidote